MLDDVKAYLREDAVLGLLFFACLFGGVFGAVNWNSYCHPNPPLKNALVSQERYDASLAVYERQVQEIGREAVIPWVWSVPLCLVGFAGAAIFGGMVVGRNLD